MDDYTSDEPVSLALSMDDTVPCPCCGEAIPNFPMIQRLDFDPDEWNKRVDNLTKMILDGYPEFADSANVFAAMIVSVSIYHAGLPRSASDVVERELRQLPLPLPIGFVYFIQAIHGGPVKIGYSRDPEARAKALQHDEELCVLTAIPGGYKFEAELHRKFASSRLTGEWFRDTPELKEFIQNVRTRQTVS